MQQVCGGRSGIAHFVEHAAAEYDTAVSFLDRKRTSSSEQ
jgi:hypothetical protein